MAHPSAPFARCDGRLIRKRVDLDIASEIGEIALIHVVVPDLIGCEVPEAVHAALDAIEKSIPVTEIIAHLALVIEV